MAKKDTKKQPAESDSVYFMKIVLYFLLGCLWVQIGGENGIALPIGLLIGLFFASHDHFQLDRRIELAILLIATMISFFAPIGFVLAVS